MASNEPQVKSVGGAGRMKPGQAPGRQPVDMQPPSARSGSILNGYARTMQAIRGVRWWCVRL